MWRCCSERKCTPNVQDGDTPSGHIARARLPPPLLVSLPRGVWSCVQINTALPGAPTELVTNALAEPQLRCKEDPGDDTPGLFRAAGHRRIQGAAAGGRVRSDPRSQPALKREPCPLPLACPCLVASPVCCWGTGSSRLCGADACTVCGTVFNTKTAPCHRARQHDNEGRCGTTEGSTTNLGV